MNRRAVSPIGSVRPAGGRCGMSTPSAYRSSRSACGSRADVVRSGRWWSISARSSPMEPPAGGAGQPRCAVRSIWGRSHERCCRWKTPPPSTAIFRRCMGVIDPAPGAGDRTDRGRWRGEIDAAENGGRSGDGETGAFRWKGADLSSRNPTASWRKGSHWCPRGGGCFRHCRWRKT